MTQEKHPEWHQQWSIHRAEDEFLFLDWIFPNNYETFKNKTVLECGCGHGQHTRFVSSYAKKVVAIDLNTKDIAEEYNKELSNVEFIDADLANVNLTEKFDVAFSIGVIHHTDDPFASVKNMVNHLKPGGKIILWVYSEEGNWMVKNIVEPVRKLFLSKMKRKKMWFLSQILTGMMMLPIYTVYKLPLKFLPFYEYFENFRKMDFYRNSLNVFDKLNAPQTYFVTRKDAEKMVEGMKNIHISPYMGVSWRISAEKMED